MYGGEQLKPVYKKIWVKKTYGERLSPTKDVSEKPDNENIDRGTKEKVMEQKLKAVIEEKDEHQQTSDVEKKNDNMVGPIAPTLNEDNNIP